MLTLEEVHEGVYADHLAVRALAFKILRNGYFWPILRQDALDYVQKCHQCQIHANITHQPPSELSPFLYTIPFAMWGIDIVGKFPKDWGHAVYCIVAVDYMTKWVEAKALSQITEVAELMEMYHIEHHTSDVAYPQGNGQVENANKSIIKGIEKILEDAKGLWVDELPHVLWAYYTNTRRAKNNTSFRLAYGTDSLVPVEVGLPSYRNQIFD
ncbi:hypothetical protein AgCh_001614 [Apium graveolens]